jgi:hypothetical protein
MRSFRVDVGGLEPPASSCQIISAGAAKPCVEPGLKVSEARGRRAFHNPVAHPRRAGFCPRRNARRLRPVLLARDAPGRRQNPL